METTGPDISVEAIYLTHRALRIEASQVEGLARQLDAGDSLQRFKLAFNSWATALIYLIEQQEKYVAAVSVDPVRPDKAADTPGLTAEILVHEEEERREQLLETIENVLAVLNEEIGKTSLILRTKRHLLRRVVALGMAQEDHLESEEALVVPLLAERMDGPQQMELARALLFDRQAEDPRWPIEWMARVLGDGERERLTRLEATWQGSEARAD